MGEVMGEVEGEVKVKHICTLDILQPKILATLSNRKQQHHLQAQNPQNSPNHL